RSTLPAAITAVATAGDLDAALRAVIEAGTAALGAASAAIVLADPDRPGLQLAASTGLDPAAATALAEAAQDPGHPFSTVANTRVSSFDREAGGAAGATGGTGAGPRASAA